MSEADWNMQDRYRIREIRSVGDLANSLESGDKFNVRDVHRTDYGEWVPEGRHETAPGIAGPKLVWRGVDDISYRLDSSLYRRVKKSTNAQPKELLLATEEDSILLRARKLRYDIRDGERLSDLELLAVLQHYGAATRLVDVTRNVLVALWFASEPGTLQSRMGGGPDGVMFGVDISNCTLPETAERQSIRTLRRNSGLVHWEPPPLEQRIRAQQGSFIFSRMPPPSPQSVAADRNTSLDLEPFDLESAFDEWSTTFPPRQKYAPKRKAKLVVFKIPFAYKMRIRAELARFYGQDDETVYPDLPGFARAWKA